MALAKELLNVLDNSGEPLAKRIKIADNAFNSPDLPLQHREAFLLKWSLKNEHVDIIKLVNNWLRSDHLRDLTRNDISNEDVYAIIQLVISNLRKSADIRNKVLESAIILLDIRIFQQYFKYNLDVYCTFLAEILISIDNAQVCCDFFRNESVFYKSIIIEDGFYSHFFSICMPVLTDLAIKFNDDKKLFESISKVLQRCIFYRNFKSFEGYINQFFIEDASTEKYHIPKAVFKYFSESYVADLEKAKICHKLIFHALCTAYNEFEVAYKSFILINEILGFNLHDKFDLKKRLKSPDVILSKSQEILLELLNVLSENKNDIDCKVNDVSFSDFIQNLLLSLVYVGSANGSVYKIFLKAITINPLIIETIIKPVVVFSMLADNSNHKQDYVEFLTAVFEVFSKLHRIQNFIAKLVPTIKAALEGAEFVEEDVQFKGTVDLKKKSFGNHKIENVLPKAVLDYFRVCITNLASWQVMNLFKTLLFHLNAAVEELQNSTKQETSYVTYMEILSGLTCCVLSSVRMAEHKVTQTVVEKFVKSLDEMKSILKHFGKALLSREHNQILVRAFLNISYNWGEVYMVLSYYSASGEISLHRHSDSNNSACNITYVHSYMSIKQWCLLSERITNFGEKPCKELMQKLFIQKLRANTIFEQSLDNDMALNVAKNLANTLEDNWKTIMLDKYVIKNLLDKLEPECVIFMAENILNHPDEIQREQIAESRLLLNALNFVILSRITKLMKQKKRQDNQPLSVQVFSKITTDFFLKNDDEVSLEAAKAAYYSNERCDIKISEAKTLATLQHLREFPAVYGSENVQKFMLLYLFALHQDVQNSPGELKGSVETIIIGLLQHVKFSLVSVFEADKLCAQIVSSFDRFETVFQHFFDGSAKQVELFDGCVSCLIENMKNPDYLRCATIYLNGCYKMKKVKLPAEARQIANEQKTKICKRMQKTVLKRGPESHLIGPYALVLKNALASNEAEDLLVRLPDFAEFALGNSPGDTARGHLLLFSTLLNNKSKVEFVDEDFPLKVWNWSKQLIVSSEEYEDYAQLVVLIFGLIPNDKFSDVTKDLLDVTCNSMDVTQTDSLIRHVKTWESIVGCSFNPVKMKLWQEALENLLQELIKLVRKGEYNASVKSCVVKFCVTVIHTNQVLLTSSMVDMLLLVASFVISSGRFEETFDQALSLLESLLKCRKPLVMDRLPAFQQLYGLLLDGLCSASDADKTDDGGRMQRLGNCAHRFEKLTNALVECKRDVARMAMYLVADILVKYERATLYVNVKIHLNNCIYSLISLCDQHAISYLMRTLSSASTEMFKVMYDNYKKYYRFTGKV